MTKPKSPTACLASPVSWRASYCGSTRNPIAPLSGDTCPNCLAAFRADELASKTREDQTR